MVEQLVQRFENESIVKPYWLYPALQQLHNGRAALAHAASLSADCGAAAGEAAPTELTASPAIGDQLGCAVIIGAAKC